MMKKRIASWAVALLLTAIPFAVLASSLRVTPIKLTFDEQSTTAVIKLMNEGDGNITVQLDAMSWDQDDQGADNYTDTKDIVFFPKILEIAPTTERIIRIGYQGDTAPAIERTYRIFVQELPVTKPGEAALTFAMTFSIPIFIRPGAERNDVTIEDANSQHGQVRVTVRNGGNTHVIVNHIKLKGLDAAGQEVFSNEMRGWYLLSNKSKTYEVPIPIDGCKQAAEIEVTMQAGSNTAVTLVDAVAGQCGTNDEATSQVVN
jgi:fimbrial chaperone protein